MADRKRRLGGRREAVIRRDLRTGEETHYASMTEAAEENGIHAAQISKACMNGSQCHGFFWRKENDN